jgi:hypothetical protein
MFARSLWSALVCVVACAVSGCGSKPAFNFEQLGLLPVEEELTEFSLGEYKIPIPVTEDPGEESPRRRNRFQFDFKLFALVSPKEDSQFADAWGRHEGVLRNQIMNICRSASIEDLQEPELATLKARMIDVLAARLGEKRLRQLLITDIVSQQL